MSMWEDYRDESYAEEPKARKTKTKVCRKRYMLFGREYKCPLKRGHDGPHGKFTSRGGHA